MATKDYKYPKDTPVDEPVAKPKQTASAPKAAAKPAAKPVMYPRDVPVDEPTGSGMKRGGKVKKMANGGSASSRADGIAQRGKTRGTMLCSGGMAKGKR